MTFFLPHVWFFRILSRRRGYRTRAHSVRASRFAQRTSREKLKRSWCACGRLSFSVMAIEVGATFNTFEEFRKALSDFQINNNVLFVTKATKKVEVVNARLSVGLERLDSKLKYANATYICKHGGVKRCSGTGIRPRQR